MISGDKEFINEYHYKYLLAVMHELNKMPSDEPVSEKKFKENIKSFVGDIRHKKENSWLDDFIRRAVEEEILEKKCENDSKGDGKLVKQNNNKILYPVSLPEKIYLKNVLKLPYAKLFLDNSTTEKLVSAMLDVPEIYFSEIIEIKGTAEEPELNEEFIGNFRKLMLAVREKKFISFSSHSKCLHKNRVFPLKIEFSVIYREFYLFFWNISEKCLDKVDITDISDVELLNEKYKDITKEIKVPKKDKPIVMEVRERQSPKRGEHNNLERVNMFFSMYHKKTERIDEKTHKISIYYYPFDEDEIIDGIMSFGSVIQVLSPQSVIDKIKERLDF